VNLGSIKLAAQKNHVTHSTISQGILKLEESYGVALTTREKRKFQPTSDGLYIYEMSHELIKSLGKFQSKIEDEYREPAGMVNFASSQSILSNIILPTFPITEKKYPKIQINFEIGRTQEIKDFISKGTVEFGITLNDNKLQGMELISIKTGSYILITSKENRNWKNSSFILTKPRPETQKLQQEFKLREQKDLDIRWLVDSWTLAADFARETNGVALVPDFIKTSSNGLKKIKWETNANYELVLIHRKNETLSPEAKIFLEEIKSTILQ
jgi:DNA-binding transcriptional LysR family regulator